MSTRACQMISIDIIIPNQPNCIPKFDTMFVFGFSRYTYTYTYLVLSVNKGIQNQFSINSQRIIPKIIESVTTLCSNS